MSHRTMFAAAALAALAASAAAYEETHVGEIADPVAAHAAARVPELEALPSPTKAEKKELATLRTLAKKLAKTTYRLEQDFAQLAACGKAARKLGDGAGGLAAALDEALRRADLSLGERLELADDHVALLVDLALAAKARKPIDKAAAARDQAQDEPTGAERAAGFARADALVTAALKKAEKLVVASRGADKLPPTRRRSGDAIDQRGGRVAVPRDSGSPVAGSSIVIPSGAFATAVVVTVEAAPDFVGGLDQRAGPAVAVSPEAQALPAGSTLVLRLDALPPGATAQDIAVIRKGPPQTVLSSVTVRPDLFVEAAVTSFGTYQAAIPAPPPGQPGGTYRVQTFAMNTAIDDGTQGVAGLLAGILEQSVTFRANGTGSTTLPYFPAVLRSFTVGPPHHADTVQTPFLSSVDFTWTSPGPGRFSFSFPLRPGVSATAEGVASVDGRVVAWTGRGDTFEFLAVGVHQAASAETADLEGRWLAVEMGVELRDDAAEPFATRWFDGFRSFAADASGAVTFEGSGSRFETDVTYRTTLADPVHDRVASSFADDGAETWSVSPQGRITGEQDRRFGWIDPDAGLLTAAWYDASRRRVALMVAVPQEAQADLSALPGLYRFAALEVGTTVTSPPTPASTHDVTPRIGSLDLPQAGDATLAFDAATRASYALSDGTPPLFRWKLAATSEPQSDSSSDLPLALLDATGSFRPVGGEIWFGFATGGRHVLGVLCGEPTRLARGIGIGVR